MHITTTEQPAVRLALRDADAVLFDFNGTLSDDEALLGALYVELATARLDLPLTAEEYEQRLVGRSDRDILVALRAASPLGRSAPSVDVLLEELTDHYVRRVTSRPCITAGGMALVHALRAAGVPLAVVTGAGRAAVLPALAAAGLEHAFAVVITEDDVAHGKPDPEGFQRAAETIGARTQRTIVLEDSLPGLAAAAAAGMRAVAVATGATAERAASAGQAVVPALSPEMLDLLVPASLTVLRAAGSGSGPRR